MAGQLTAQITPVSPSTPTKQLKTKTGPARIQPPGRQMSKPAGLLQHLTDVHAQALRLAGDGRIQPVSAGGVQFLLNKAAATVIPLRLWQTAADSAHQHEGPLYRVRKLGDVLHLTGPDWHFLLPLGSEYAAWIVYAAGAGEPPFALAVFEPGHERLVQISGLRSRCIAWAALMQWLLLRERE